MYDLSLIIDENKNGLSLGWEYNSDIFDVPTIQRMSGHFERLLESMIQFPETEVARANMMSDEEMNQVMIDFNQTAQRYPQEKTIIDLFEEQATATPEHVAVSYEDRSYTYRALDQVSNQLAAYLKDHYAVQPDDLIGIQLERSEEILLSVISILKSGGAYVPIGTGYPEDRITYIIKDAGIKVLINEEELSRFFSVQGKYSKEPLSLKPSAGDLAYCIYTSGSTGQPKGVLNQHTGLFNRLVWMKAYLNVTEREVFLQKTPYTFDVSVWELLLPVICGAQLVFAVPEGHKDPFYLQHIIEEKKVTIIHFVPSMLNIFLNNLEHTACSSLKHIVCSGEALPVKVVVECKQKLNSRIHNLYGPTEAAIDVTAVDLTDIDTDTNGVTIGYPIANTSIYIVNDAMVLQPAGIPGELLIGGVQVARGYLNRPELSKEKFIENPFKKGDRLYKTGDVAKWNTDGSIVYLGRRDSQVKIRGHRIELGEVTAQLLSKPSINEAVVSVTKKGELDRELVAYIVSGIDEDVSTLRKFLADRVPDYEIPAYFIQLAALPLSANGKVDEKALPEPGANTLKGDTAYVAPRNEKEQKLIEIFARELGLEPSEIGINDNFFDLGANSLKLIKILNEIKAAFKDEFNADIKPVLLFQYTNINDLVSVLEASSKQELAVDEASVSTDMDDMIALF
jgi:amino acid adenylation domain-containing protein